MNQCKESLPYRRNNELIPSWMHMAEVYFLGTGNAFSPPGRMHALALIDSKILIDCPPTVIPQLIRGNCLPSELKHLLITHWHADHTFGLPFLLLNRKLTNDKDILALVGLDEISKKGEK